METMDLGQSCFQDALQLVRTALNDRLNLSAQTTLANEILCVAIGLRSASLIECLTLNEKDIAVFLSLFRQASVKGLHNLDILTIGSNDNNFVIHRGLLLQDIQEYLSHNPKSIRRLFVDVNHRLAKPEILPGNRCLLLEEYVRDILKPEIESRVTSCQREGFRRNRLPTPSKISNVTLTEWLLSYPIIYVLPKTCAMAPKQKQQQERYPGSFPYETGNGKHERGDGGDDGDDDEEEDDEGACGRNCLADRDLVVTNVRLEPNKDVEGLTDHSMISFSYPAHLAESCQTIEFPPKPSERTRGGIIGDGIDDDGDDDVFVDASDVEYQSRSGSLNLSTLKKPLEPDCFPDSVHLSQNNPPEHPSDPYKTHHYQPQPQSNSRVTRRNLSEEPHSLLVREQLSALKEKLQLQKAVEHASMPASDSYNRVESESPFPKREDVFTAGRSFLLQMHHRFKRQQVFKTWEVDQQTVNLPVVGL
ncbi:hypothetical protein BGZ79_004502 [Entomortierella chlamydospora]|nr:hypothetical protein BGZ79_004502 [Entomortierella chlamydospora]